MVRYDVLLHSFPEKLVRQLGTVASLVSICVALIAPTVTSVEAAELAKHRSAAKGHVPQVSNRLIVKLRPNSVARGLGKEQIREELRRPYRKQELDEISGAAGVELAESHALSDGAHVLVIPGKRDRQTLDDAITRISALANVEYVEEDKLFTPQGVPIDYYAVRDPGLWGLYPVTPVALPSQGREGSYGADFQAAWGIATGTGVVVAVVDGGITPHVDIVGTDGTVSPATGNLVSAGYDFISDCRRRGSTAIGGCVAATSDSAATVAPSPDATDTGDFVSAQDSRDNPTLFPSSLISPSTWHGTHIAGIVAAIGNNATGVIGGAYDVKILPVRVLGKGVSSSSDVMEGVRWAAGLPVPGAELNPHPAKVINLSLGGPGVCGQSEQAAIDEATAAGAVVVVAAGNGDQNSKPMDLANFVPANCNNVIAVVAVARDGSRATYSNFSSPTNVIDPSRVILAAPGGDQVNYPATYDPGILSTINTSASTPDLSPSTGSDYAYYDGTSMASVHVAAVIALMFSRNPVLTPAQVRKILSAPASLTEFPSFDPNSGYTDWDCATNQNCGVGLLNARLAVQNTIPLLTPDMESMDFGNRSINSTTGMAVTLRNLTGAALVVSPAATNDSSFVTVAPDGCATTPTNPPIGDGGTCQVTVNFTPRSTGTYSAVLSIPVTGSGATLVSLTGSSDPATSNDSGGGGCAVMPYSNHPDSSLLVTLLLAVIYRVHQRLVRSRVQV